MRREDPSALLGKGAALNSLGWYEDALESFGKVLSVRQDDPLAWFGKGQALASMGRYQEALEPFDKAIGYDKGFHDAWNKKGAVLAGLGHYQDAIEAFDTGLSLRQDNAGAWLGKGVALAQLGCHEESIENYDQALAIGSDDPNAWWGKGIALWQLGKTSDAQHAFEKAFGLREGLLDRRIGLYEVWSRLTLAQGLDAMLNNDIKAFEEAGLKFTDILEKAQEDGMGQVEEDALAIFKARLKKKKELKAFEELEVFINLMKIKDPFEGWRAIGKEVSKRWPKGHSVKQAVREMRR